VIVTFVNCFLLNLAKVIFSKIPILKLEKQVCLEES